MSDSKSNRRVRPSKTAEAQEQQMIALAVDLAEKQLIEGTASAQVITHYLKLATVREQLEKRELEARTRMLEAKIKAYEATGLYQEQFDKVLESLKSYQGTNSYVPEDTNVL